MEYEELFDDSDVAEIKASLESFLLPQYKNTYSLYPHKLFQLKPLDTTGKIYLDEDTSKQIVHLMLKGVINN